MFTRPGAIEWLAQQVPPDQYATVADALHRPRLLNAYVRTLRGKATLHEFDYLDGQWHLVG